MARRGRANAPQDCGGRSVHRAVENFRRGDPKGGGTINENGRHAVAPSERTRASERGWVFPPADDPHKKGAPPKGGRRGENQGGGNRSRPPPRRAIRKTRTAQRERLQRRARSPAGDVTARPRAGAVLGCAYSTASVAKRPTYPFSLKTCHAEGMGPKVVKIRHFQA